MNNVAQAQHNPYVEHWRTALRRVEQRVRNSSTIVTSGRIVRATGLVLEAVGLSAPLGSACLLESSTDDSTTQYAETEVVGFANGKLFLMPLEEVSGLVPGARVLPLQENNSRARHFPVGGSLLGRVVDGCGRPLDDRLLPDNIPRVSLNVPPLNPLSRAPIDTHVDVGVRSINTLLSVGRGQRMGLFAGSGVGKSVLLGMMARYTRADIIVVALIGERGREVQDFIDNTLGAEGLARSVVVAAPADTSPLQRLQGASYATRLAEYFRDHGRHVLLIMDSLTRYAMAQREIALAIGEPPATKGYPPSVFARIPALVERAGNGRRGSGSITAFYTVLTEGDDQQDPIADAARAILDGHIVLSRNLAEAGHYPAIDVEASISRAMSNIVTPTHLQQSHRFKQLFSLYHRNRDMIGVGAYSPGHDPDLDHAVQMYPQLKLVLCQSMHECADLESSMQALQSTIGEAA